MLEELKKFFQKQKSVIACYIFGSTLRPSKFKGDLDIAILVKEENLKNGITSVHNKIWLELSSFLKRKDIDLVILNVAPLLLKYEVVKNGKLIFERDIESRINFEVKTQLYYFDFLPIRRMFWKELVKRVEDGRFGEPSY